MTTVDALIDIARTFRPMEREAVVTINCSPNGVYAQAIRENYELWKFFYANETGDRSMLVNSFGYGNLHNPDLELQGDYVLWDPTVIQQFNKFLPLAKKEITFDNDSKVWFASFREGDAMAKACLGTGRKMLNLVVPRFQHLFPKLTWTVDRNAVKQFQAMLKQAATNGIEAFWLFSTKNNQICASFDRQPKSNSTRRVVLANGIASAMIVPYTFPAQRFADLLELTENGSIVTVELAVDSCLNVQVGTNYGNYTFVLLGSADLIYDWHLDYLLPPSPPIDRRGYGEPCMYVNWNPDLTPPR